MDVATGFEEDSNVDKIRTILNALKKQINQYNFRGKSMKSKAELTRGQRIERLIMESRHLSLQFQKIRREIHRYEKKYEKALKKKVKYMKIQIEEDKLKLNLLKQKYNDLGIQAGNAKLLVMQKEKKTNLRRSGRSLPIKRNRPKFKQRSAPINRKIKIKIKTNKKLGRREISFVNDDNVQQLVSEPEKSVESLKDFNIRKCKVTLEKLTEQQIGEYIVQKQTDQEQTNNKQSVTRSQLSKPILNWHIKIPKSILEECQNEYQNLEPNATSSEKNTS